MPVPTDPYNFVVDTIADPEQVDARFAPLYEALDGALDETNMAVPKGTFFAYRATALALTASPQTIVFDGELFDVSGWLNTSTGLFTPQVAGFYRFSWNVLVPAPGGSGRQLVAGLQKNGLVVAQGQSTLSSAGVAQNSAGSAIAQANGTSDAFGVQVGGFVGEALSPTAGNTFFCGELIGRSS